MIEKVVGKKVGSLKYLFFLLACCSLAFGADHNLVLKFNQDVDLNEVLAGYDVVSYRKLNANPIYQVRINSSLDRQTLLSQFYDIPNFSMGEKNQTASIRELEGASTIDARRKEILDDIDGRPPEVLDAVLEPYANLMGQDHVYLTRAVYAWPYVTGQNVVVAVIDTGVDASHPFLAGSMVPGYDFVDNDANPHDERPGLDSNGNGIFDEGWGHGTHVAGIVKTVAPCVSIMPIRVVDSDGQLDLFSVVQGIAFAMMNGADIINLSMSIEEPSQVLVDCVNAAKNAGIVVITSAGNNNNTDIQFPGMINEVLTVGSISYSGLKSSFSNYSGMVDVVAPGEGIYSCLPGGAYVSRSGTSMATPMVAGQAAILLSLVPSASVEWIVHRIENKAYNIDYLNPSYSNLLGNGLIDVWNAITTSNQ